MSNFIMPSTSIEIEQLIKDWVRRADHLMSELFAASIELNSTELNERERWVLGSLSNACLRSSGSILILIENGREWDATILDRSLTEGTLKYLYLIEKRSTFTERILDFSEHHFEVANLKDHSKAEEFLRCFDVSKHEGFPSIRGMLLEQQYLDLLKAKYDRKDRQQIEARWGVASLVQQLTASQLPAANLFPTFLQAYSMSSHVAHMDSIGVEIVSERMTRDNLRSIGVRVAHIGGLLHNTCAFELVRSLTFADFIGKDPTPIKDALKAHDSFLEELTEAKNSWHRIEYGA